MHPGEEEIVLRRAEFDADGIIKYHWMGLVMASLLIVTIPITLIIAIVYKIVLTRIIASWDCVLMTRSLNVKPAGAQVYRLHLQPTASTV